MTHLIDALLDGLGLPHKSPLPRTVAEMKALEAHNKRDAALDAEMRRAGPVRHPVPKQLELKF